MIAARVANCELCPVVVSFSPAMRAQLRLAKRYKHTRIFVETNEVTSLAALHTALMREIPHPLAEVPRVAFDAARGLCSRRAWPLLAARPPAGRHRLSSESRPRKILPTKTRMSPLTSQQHQVEQHAP